MSTRRFTTAEPCPLDGAPVDMMSICQPCRYFRGASSSRHEKHGWDVCCNWPRDGMHLAAPNEGHELPGVEIAVTRRLPIRGSITAHHERHGWEMLCDGTAFDECCLELDERAAFLADNTS